MYSVESRIAVQSRPSSGTNQYGCLVAPTEASPASAFVTSLYSGLRANLNQGVNNGSSSSSRSADVDG